MLKYCFCPHRHCRCVPRSVVLNHDTDARLRNIPNIDRNSDRKKTWFTPATEAAFEQSSGNLNSEHLSERFRVQAAFTERIWPLTPRTGDCKRRWKQNRNTVPDIDRVLETHTQPPIQSFVNMDIKLKPINIHFQNLTYTVSIARGQ